MDGELLKWAAVTELVYESIFPFIKRAQNYQDFFSERFGNICLEASILFFCLFVVDFFFFLSNMDEDYLGISSSKFSCLWIM